MFNSAEKITFIYISLYAVAWNLNSLTIKFKYMKLKIDLVLGDILLILMKYDSEIFCIKYTFLKKG